MSEFGVYLHVPFCQSRCLYCDFYSTTLDASWQHRYADALGREMQLRCTELCPPGESPRARSIYIGGGTPSQLSPAVLHRLFALLAQHFQWTEGTEITLEANPDDVTPQWVQALRHTPVNRISMGVQSLDDRLLRLLHRRHTAADAQRALQLLRQAGYSEISLDLIYGLPGQSLAQFQHDVDALLQWGVPHLSAYALQWEPGTRLWQMRQRGELCESPDELMLSQYHHLIDATAAAGMQHYEISNFALPGHHSRHNSSYWQGIPYLGLGPGAHSYDGHATRRENLPSLARYTRYYGQGTSAPPYAIEHLTPAEQYDEMVMLRLRTPSGLSLAQVRERFGAPMAEHCLRMAQPHLRQGHLRQTGETLCLTRQSLFISDSVIRDLLAD